VAAIARIDRHIERNSAIAFLIGALAAQLPPATVERCCEIALEEAYKWRLRDE
jgi:hypothetical protein